jgi:Xaa-Pro aminopeptidase
VGTDRRGDRRAALLRLLAHQGLDGLIVTALANVRYLTGFTGSAGVAVVLAEETLFFSDFRYRTQSDHEVGDLARIEITTNDLWERVGEVLSGYAGVRSLGVEARAVSVSEHERIGRAVKRAALEPTTDLVEGLRVEKAPEEVAAIRQAAELAAEALEATLATVRPGQREVDVAARLEHELRLRGSEWHPFHTTVASGPQAALPHARATEREIGVGELLLLDFGAQVDGYCADITRTVVVGAAADERQRTIYALVREAQLAAREHMRAGMTGRDADALARSVIEARGFGDAFGHSLGHGLGLEVHEAPRVSCKNEDPLPDGAVVTIEPGVYVPGWGGVRIEDDVHLTPGGLVLLSDGETQLRELT